MNQIIFWPFIASLLTSLACCALIVLTQRWHGHISHDHDLVGAQKFHETPVPRIGGVGIALSLLIGAVAEWHLLKQEVQPLALIICGAPAFLVGLLEDLTKKVSVLIRLLATFSAAALSIWILNAKIGDVDTPMLDSILSVSPFVAYAFTCFAVGGVANAVNIIDGFNGLAGTACALMFAGLAAIAHGVGDVLVVKLCLIGIASLVGFLLLNFPFGKIFMGDGGAYLVGFWLAECAVLLLSRNHGVSAWAVLLCCIYPVWETIFSMWRKSVLRDTGMGRPDKLHFHMLVYRRWTRRCASSGSPAWWRHMLTTLLIGSSVACVQLYAYLASIFFDTHGAYALGIALYVCFYCLFYKRLTIKVAGFECGRPVESGAQLMQK